jgi:hypothetical protein
MSNIFKSLAFIKKTDEQSIQNYIRKFHPLIPFIKGISIGFRKKGWFSPQPLAEWKIPTLFY